MRWASSLILLLLLAGCGRGPDVDLADPEASRETRFLFANLQDLAGDHVLFGHHDDLAYGVSWNDEPGRSDVKEAAGAYPALYGWDASRLYRGEEQRTRLREWILEGYERGGVIAMCWHMRNPVTGRSFYDTTRAVHAILPGGERHDFYKAKLDTLADFLNSLETSSLSWLGFSEKVPVIFRPFHEHTGSWFWWGENHATVDDFVALWRFTVEYLRDEKDVHNVLYSYSTDVFDSKERYLERYPGDDYIDVLGYDDYHSVQTTKTQEAFAGRLRMLVEMAEARGKVAALTETGVEGVPDSTWWTEVLLPGIQADSVGQRIAFVMVWRNAHDIPGHFYAPHPDHPSAPDFVRFYQDPYVLFEDELPDLYSR